MDYTIILINGREYDITDSEKSSILGKSGFVFLPRLDITVNTSSISVIEPRGLGKKIDRSKQVEGRLHDGSRVIKKFGQWVDSVNPEVHISPSYYPEIAGDFVVTPEEFAAEIEPLPVFERLGAMKRLVTSSTSTVAILERVKGMKAINGFEGVRAITEGNDYAARPNT